MSEPLEKQLSDALQRIKALEEALLEARPPQPVDWDAMRAAAERESSELEVKLLAGREAAHNALTDAGVQPVYSSMTDPERQFGVAQRIRWLAEQRDDLKVRLDLATRCNCPGPCNAQACLLRELERARLQNDDLGKQLSVQLGQIQTLELPRPANPQLVREVSARKGGG